MYIKHAKKRPVTITIWVEMPGRAGSLSKCISCIYIIDTSFMRSYCLHVKTGFSDHVESSVVLVWSGVKTLFGWPIETLLTPAGIAMCVFTRFCCESILWVRVLLPWWTLCWYVLLLSQKNTTTRILTCASYTVRLLYSVYSQPQNISSALYDLYCLSVLYAQP